MTVFHIPKTAKPLFIIQLTNDKKMEMVNKEDNNPTVYNGLFFEYLKNEDIFSENVSNFFITNKS